MELYDQFEKWEGLAGIDMLQARGDWAGVVKVYLDLGQRCYSEGDRERAWLWIGRVKTICGNIYGIYGDLGVEDAERVITVGDSIEDDVWKVPIYTRQMERNIEAAAQALDEGQRALWGMLTICRLEKLLIHLGNISGCDSLRGVQEVIDIILATLYEGVGLTEVNKLQGYERVLYDVLFSMAYMDSRQTIPVSGAGAFQLFDLNGSRTLLNVIEYLLHVVEGPLDPATLEDPIMAQVAAEVPLDRLTQVVPCALLEDYYLRTRHGLLKDMAPVQEEEARIWGDLYFVRNHPSEREVRFRAAEYRALELPVAK